MLPSIPDESKDLPLEKAYLFGRELGHGEAVNAIRDMVIDHGPAYADWIRRGYIISLFTERNIYQKFKQLYWPNGDSADGAARISVYYEAKRIFDAANNATTELRKKVKEEEGALLSYSIGDHKRDRCPARRLLSPRAAEPQGKIYSKSILNMLGFSFHLLSGSQSFEPGS